MSGSAVSGPSPVSATSASKAASAVRPDRREAALKRPRPQPLDLSKSVFCGPRSVRLTARPWHPAGCDLDAGSSRAFAAHRCRAAGGARVSAGVRAASAGACGAPSARAFRGAGAGLACCGGRGRSDCGGVRCCPADDGSDRGERRRAPADDVDSSCARLACEIEPPGQQCDEVVTACPHRDVAPCPISADERARATAQGQLC